MHGIKLPSTQRFLYQPSAVVFTLVMFRRETMETMLAEQHYLRSPLRPFSELDTHNNNLTLEEKALLAARSQLFLRAAAAAAGPYGSLMSPVWGGPGPGVPPVGIPPGVLWGQWACLGPSILAAHQQHAHLAAAAAASVSSVASASSSPPAISLPRPLYPAALASASTLSQHRFSPYASPVSNVRRSPVSSPDSCQDNTDPPPQSPNRT